MTQIFMEQYLIRNLQKALSRLTVPNGKKKRDAIPGICTSFRPSPKREAPLPVYIRPNIHATTREKQ